MKKLLRFLALAVFIIALPVAAGATLLMWPRSHTDMPPLETGDLILQSHKDIAAWPVSIASQSRFSHIGIIVRKTDGTLRVLDSSGSVGERDLEQWINLGHGRQFEVYRDTRLTPLQKAQLVNAAHTYDGMPYDYVFLFDNDSLYCSELVYNAYRDIGVNIGKVQKISSLKVNNPVTEWLIKKRWRMHPKCKDLNYAACRKLVMNQELITPGSIADDKNVQLIYSNYWF